MQKKFFETLRDGKEYSEIWPQKAELDVVFPEERVIKLTHYLVSIMPMLAVVTLAFHYQFLGHYYLPQGLAWAGIMLSLPVQGLYWLGKRANTELPPGVNAWYRDIYHRMEEQGVKLASKTPKPRYFELARLLQCAFTEMDKAFLRKSPKTSDD